MRFWRPNGWIMDRLLRLKAVEDMVEVHYNSGQYTETLREMEQHWASPYAMFEALADYYERLGYTGIAIKPPDPV